MPMRRLRLTDLATALAGAILFGLAPALSAQTPNLLSPGPVVGTAPAAPPRPLPPPGLPGAVSKAGTPAPPPAAQSELSPTAALFDAINRGDLAAAREAIGRGAQLDARNVLGMTPLELAVDLNRNAIAFLLLSIVHERGAAADSAGSALALSVPPAPAAVPGSRAGNDAAAGAAGKSVAALLVATSPPAAGVPAAQAARALPKASPLPGGADNPDPAVGFLGFGQAAGGAGRN